RCPVWRTDPAAASSTRVARGPRSYAVAKRPVTSGPPPTIPIAASSHSPTIATIGRHEPPMIPELSADDLAVREAVRTYARNELAPKAAAFDESGDFVGAHLPGLSAVGIMGLNLPEDWGGAGITALGLVGAVEEIAAACAATASMVTAHFLASDAILLAGDEPQKTRYLPGAAAGRLL